MADDALLLNLTSSVAEQQFLRSRSSCCSPEVMGHRPPSPGCGCEQSYTDVRWRVFEKFPALYLFYGCVILSAMKFLPDRRAVLVCTGGF